VLRELDNLLALRERPGFGRSSTLPLISGPARRDQVEPGRSAPLPSRRAGDESVSAAQALQRRAEAAQRRQRREAALRAATVRRALLVDDSEVALAFLERHLHRHDIDSDWAMESTKALELLAQREYGIVFVDIDLGERSPLDGYALCQRIKRDALPEPARVPPVVLVSAANDAVARVRGTLVGADGHLGKPLNATELDRLLDHHGLAGPGARRRPPPRA
jgi:CheY-like chemotaxis protein